MARSVVDEDKDRGDFQHVDDKPGYSVFLTNRNHKVSPRTRRRFNKQIRDLRDTFFLNRDLFDRRWDRLIQGWLHEIHHRATCWAEGKEFTDEITKEQIIEQGQMMVFGVIEIADSVLEACGPEIQSLVGTNTKELLKNESIRAVARVVDHRLNFPVDRHYHRKR